MILLQIFLILTIFSSRISESTAELPPLSDDLDQMRKSFLTCTINVIKKYFEVTETIAFSLPPKTLTENQIPLAFDQEFLVQLHQIANWTIFMKRFSSIYRFVAVNRKKTHNYIFQVRNHEDLYNTINYVKQSQWNPRARFIVLLFEVSEEIQEIVLQIAKTLWKYHIINSIILVPRYNDTSTIDVHTWFPYHMGNCGKNFTETVILDSCTNGQYSNNEVNLYPEKIPLDMNGCPVVVRTVLWPPFVISPPNLDRTQIGINFTEGIEIEMMNAIAKAANFKVVYTISVKIQDWGLLYDNGSASGGLYKQLLDEKADIGMSALAATVNRYNYLDFTNSYSTESVTWCVPIAKEESRWISLIKILQFYTWLATIGSFLLVGLIIWRISLLSSEESMIFKNLSTCYLYSFSSTLCIAIKTLPRNFYIRIVFIMWAIYSYTLCAAFQTSLIGKLTQPDYAEQINNVEKIFESKMQFGYLNGLQIYFQDSSDVAMKVHKEGVICENAEKCIQKVADDRDFALVVPRAYLTYVSTAHYDKNGRLKIYWFKGDTVSYPIQMFCYKGFPLINRINDLTLRIKSGGLIKKWLSDTILSYMRNRKKQAGNVDEGEEKNQVLKYEHLQGPFMLLICGLSLSTMVFFAELAHFKIRQLLKTYKSN